MQRRLQIDKAHTMLNIFRFAVFFSFLKPPAWFYVPRQSIFLLAGLRFLWKTKPKIQNLGTINSKCKTLKCYHINEGLFH